MNVKAALILVGQLQAVASCSERVAHMVHAHAVAAHQSAARDHVPVPAGMRLQALLQHIKAVLGVIIEFFRVHLLQEGVCKILRVDSALTVEDGLNPHDQHGGIVLCVDPFCIQDFGNHTVMRGNPVVAPVLHRAAHHVGGGSRQQARQNSVIQFGFRGLFRRPTAGGKRTNFSGNPAFTGRPAG